MILDLGLPIWKVGAVLGLEEVSWVGIESQWSTGTSKEEVLGAEQARWGIQEAEPSARGWGYPMHLRHNRKEATMSPSP